jgi:hypothetical protein
LRLCGLILPSDFATPPRVDCRSVEGHPRLQFEGNKTPFAESSGAVLFLLHLPNQCGEVPLAAKSGYGAAGSSVSASGVASWCAFGVTLAWQNSI